MFLVGQKVECVDASANCRGILIEGQVYTVDGIDYRDFADDSSWPGVYLAEVKVEETDEFYDSFVPTRFRPIVENKTDIGFAHEILRKASKTRETVA